MQLARFSAVHIPRMHRNRAAVLMHSCDFETRKNGGPCITGMVAKNRLETRLPQKKPATRTDGVDAFIQVRDYVRELATRNAIHDDERAVRIEFLLGLLLHSAFDSKTAEHLDRARMKIR